MKEATLAIIVQNEKVLLGYKKKGEIGTGTLNGPGGKLEYGESLLECVVRETKEEVDIDLDPNALQKIAVIEFTQGEIPDFLVHIYWTDTFSGKPKETIDMIPDWYDIENLPFDRMLESDREWFEKVIHKEKFRAKVYYKERAAGFRNIEYLPYA